MKKTKGIPKATVHRNAVDSLRRLTGADKGDSLTTVICGACEMIEHMRKVIDQLKKTNEQERAARMSEIDRRYRVTNCAGHIAAGLVAEYGQTMPDHVIARQARSIADMIDVDMKAHDFAQMYGRGRSTETGRISCSEPNISNTPKRGYPDVFDHSAAKEVESLAELFGMKTPDHLQRRGKYVVTKLKERFPAIEVNSFLGCIFINPASVPARHVAEVEAATEEFAKEAESLYRASH